VISPLSNDKIEKNKMNYIKALENPIFKIIAQASEQLGLESYVIGGFVRDYLLQRDFKKDIDIVAIGSGIDLALKVSELLQNNPKFRSSKIMVQPCFVIKISTLNLWAPEKKVMPSTVEILL